MKPGNQQYLEASDKTAELYRENKMTYPTKDFSKLRPHKGAESHIFSGENIKPAPGRRILDVKDSVKFDYGDDQGDMKFHKRRVDCINTNANTGSRIFPKGNDGYDE